MEREAGIALCARGSRGMARTSSRVGSVHIAHCTSHIMRISTAHRLAKLQSCRIAESTNLIDRSLIMRPQRWRWSGVTAPRARLAEPGQRQRQRQWVGYMASLAWLCSLRSRNRLKRRGGRCNSRIALSSNEALRGKAHFARSHLETPLVIAQRKDWFISEKVREALASLESRTQNTEHRACSLSARMQLGSPASPMRGQLMAPQRQSNRSLVH